MPRDDAKAYRTPLPGLLAALLESGINRALALDPESETRLERLADAGAAALRGKRLGLVVHAASVTADGRHAIDVVRGLGGQSAERRPAAALPPRDRARRR